MRSPIFELVALIMLLSVGCGGGAPAVTGGGPHQGALLKLPNNRGFAELVVENLATAKAKSSPTEVAVYFLKPDLASPLSPTPSEVSIDINDFESKSKILIPLTSTPKADDPSGAARFSTGATDRDYGNFPLSGRLKANLGDTSIDQPF